MLKWYLSLARFLVTSLIASHLPDSGFHMQNAEKREKCYSARDVYHQCLDQQLGDPDLDCTPQRRPFEESCPASWASYFDQQRMKQLTLEGQLAAKRPGGV